MSTWNKLDSGDGGRPGRQISELDIAFQSTRGFVGTPEPVSGSGPLKLSSFGTMLDRLGLGYVVLDEHKNIIGWNSMAKAALNVSDDPKDLRKAISSAFRQLITNVHCQLSPGTLSWIVIPHVSGMPVVMHEKCDFAPSDKSVVFLLARDTRRKPNGLRLQKLFGLTGAETEVALSIACGHTLLEIAQSRKLSRTTIRSHLASLFAKTETRRQSELISLLTSMSALP
jgi:DNA-binding CsgD family transcriptional regulator